MYRNLSLGMRHLVNAYDVEAGTVWFAGNTVWSVPERLECEVLQKVRYINTLTFTFTFTVIGTLAVDGWAVRFGKVRRGLGGAAAHPGPSSLYEM